MTASWQAAWTQGGRRGIHLGNTAEFAAQFSGRPSAGIRRQHRYAALAMFLSPHPAVVLLPGPLDPRWTELQRQALSWDQVEVHTDVAGPRAAGPAGEPPPWGLSAAVLHRPALLDRLRRLPGPLHPWGHTPGLSRLAAAVGRPVAGDVRAGLLSGESKTAGNALLRSVAARHPAIEVPEQQRYGSLGPAARAALRTVRRGRPVVVKSDHGAGGSGVVLVTPDTVRAAGGEHAFRRVQLDRLAAADTGPYVVEPLYRGLGALRDLTVDVFIDGGSGEGTPHLVGVAEMDVVGGRYRGADVGPGAVPQRWADPAGRFALDVAGALARNGYRGWFDIDLVLDRGGRLVATEINCRFTGPGAAFCIAARLDAVRGRPTAVRLRDELPLPAHLPEELLYEHLVALGRDCARIGVSVIPTLVTPAPDPAAAPSYGLALAAGDRAALDQAEGLATAAARRWGALSR